MSYTCAVITTSRDRDVEVWLKEMERGPGRKPYVLSLFPMPSCVAMWFSCPTSDSLLRLVRKRFFFRRGGATCSASRAPCCNSPRGYTWLPG